MRLIALTWNQFDARKLSLIREYLDPTELAIVTTSAGFSMRPTLSRRQLSRTASEIVHLLGILYTVKRTSFI